MKNSGISGIRTATVAQTENTSPGVSGVSPVPRSRVVGFRRISCPLLALWSATGAVASWYDPLDIWRDWADEVSGGPMQAGHFLPEEAPDETTRRLLGFLVSSVSEPKEPKG